jgi:hypothetical protein
MYSLIVLIVDTETIQTPKVAETRPGIKRTSLNVREELWDQFRIAAIRRRMTATVGIESALRHWVSLPDEQAAA